MRKRLLKVVSFLLNYGFVVQAMIWPCSQVSAMQNNVITPTVIQVDKGSFKRTYEYDSSSKRWKLKKEVRNLWRSSEQEEIIKEFTENSGNSEMVEVKVSSKVNGPGGYKLEPGRHERITCADYEALDYRESDRG